MRKVELEITSYRKRIENLNSKIQLSQSKKREIIEYVKRLTLLHHKSKISNEQYNIELYRFLKGSSYDEWIRYYDSYINECHKEISNYSREINRYKTKEIISNKVINTVSSPYFIIFALLTITFGFFLFTGTTPFEPTGLVIGNVTFNQTNIEYLIGNNLSDVNVTLELKRNDLIPAGSNVTVMIINENSLILNISSMNLTDFILNSTIPLCTNGTIDVLNDVDNVYNWEGETAYGYAHNDTQSGDLSFSLCNDGDPNSNIYDVNLREFFEGGDPTVPSEIGIYNISMNITNQSDPGEEQVVFTTQLFVVGNPAPIFDEVSNFTLNEDFATAIELNLSDNVTDAIELDRDINYTITLTDSSVITAEFDLINGTGNLTFRSVANVTGETNVNVTVYDLNGTGVTNSTLFTVTINAVNDPPGLATIADFSLNEDFTIFELNISENLTDIDDPHRDINYTSTSSDTSVITVQIENGTGNLTFFSVANATGSSTINITAYDNNGSVTDGLNDSKEFVITVNAVNDNPLFNDIGNFSITEDSQLQELNISLNISDVDDPHRDLNYTIFENNSLFSILAVENGTGNFTYQPSGNVTGTTTINITVIDSNGTGLIESDTFDLTINAVNDKPLFDAIADIDLDANFATFEINLSDNVTDVEDPDSQLNYTIENNNSAALTTEFDLINGTGNLTIRAVQDVQNTNATINITLYDQNGEAGYEIESDEFIITIGSITNVAPEITFLSENVNSTFDPLEGDIRNIEFSVIINDSDGDADIGNVTANFTQGTILRENITMCVPEETGTDTFSVNFSCTIGLQYFDLNGDYIINIEANDSQGVTAINNTITLTYNLLTAMNLSVNALTLSTANPDDQNITNSTDTSFLNITNTGNQPGLNISVNASDLGNETTIFTIPAENFTFGNISIDYTGSSFAECMDSTIDDPLNQTTNLVNATLTSVNGIIERGAGETSSLYLCLRHVPAGIPGVAYSTSLGGSWSIQVALEP
ncbi:hypothetical protein HYX17_01985 [Candidatus Woesearchaeota archaeon]|nr:hypothetical protein [Candidatus Woesearchaeota archaeon]